jgi:hypothetical protein
MDEVMAAEGGMKGEWCLREVPLMKVLSKTMSSRVFLVVLVIPTTVPRMATGTRPVSST